MIDMKDLYWLAGLLEGEGHFGDHTGSSTNKRRYIRISLKMTDKDVVDRAAKLLGTKVHKYSWSADRNPNHSVAWVTQVSKQKEAASWMMTLYPLMGERRKARIAGLLESWRQL